MATASLILKNYKKDWGYGLGVIRIFEVMLTGSATNKVVQILEVESKILEENIDIVWSFKEAVDGVQTRSD